MGRKLTELLWKGGLLLSPLVVRAQGVTGLPDPPEANIQDVGGFVCLLEDIVNVVFWVFILVAILFIIVAAFRYLTSGGDPEKVRKANWSLLVAVIAIIVAVIAWVVPRIVTAFLGTTLADACA